MMRVSATYKNEFVLSFRKACQKLGISQAEVIRNAMQDAIDQAKKWKLTKSWPEHKKNRLNSGLICYGASERNWTAVSTLARWRSTIELHSRNGGPDEIRTRDLLRDRETR